MKLNLRQMVTGVSVAAIAIGLSTVTGQQQAQAFTLAGDTSGWNYAIGSFNSGTGGSLFEMHGIAYKDNGKQMTVAINANMAYNQSVADPAPDGKVYKITYGDLFFNFTGQNFKAASDAGKLFGVRFATTDSESGAATTGIYSGVTAKAVGNDNWGWRNLTDYRYFAGKQNSDSYGDLKSSSSYFEQGTQSANFNNTYINAISNKQSDFTIQNSIGSGTKTGDISMLTVSVLKTAGLKFDTASAQVNPGQAIGSQIFGFTFDKPQGFSGDFMSNMFFECGNDGLAIKGNAAAVPEPTTMAGIALAGAGLVKARRRRVKQQAAN